MLPRNIFKTASFLFLTSFFCLLFASGSRASDLDLITQVKMVNTPNILILMDVSGSMSASDTTMAGVTTSRLAVAKKVLTEIIEENPDMRWGLMTFPDHNKATGTLQYPCQDMTSGYLAQLKTTINAQKAVGTTPLATALAEAGFYFAGGTSFVYPRVAYTSPIQNVCQPNYVVILTDGMPEVDIGVKAEHLPAYNSWRLVGSSVLYYKGYYLDGRTIRDYITDHNLGYLFENDSDFINNMYFDERNPDVAAPLQDSDFYNNSPTQYGYTFDHTTTRDTLLELKHTGQPYVYGYNPDDPSRSIPAVLIRTSVDGTQWVSLQVTGYYKGLQIIAETFGSDYLDDVAAFLYNEDLLLDYGEKGSQFEKQNVKTFVIGFKIDGGLLLRTAVQGGTGKAGYMTADNYEQLMDAFKTVLTSIKDDTNMFVTPSLPLSGDGVYSGDKMYLGLFKAGETSWSGNLKRYTMTDNSMAAHVDENNSIRKDARSDWSLVVDGNDVTKGGAASVLERQLSSGGFTRKIATYIDGNGSKELFYANIVSTANGLLTPGLMDVNSPAELEALIDRLHTLPFGAVIHSRMVLERYDNEKIMLYVGANDGFLHAIDDRDGSEKWVFIMPEHLSTIKNSGVITPLEGQYYVDGGIGTLTLNGRKIMVFGARRGGGTYVALDISDYDHPKFMYQIPGLPKDANCSGWDDLKLGQSWGQPLFRKISAAADDYVIVLPGGYDELYDFGTPAAGITNAAGNAIIGVNLLDGQPNEKFMLLNGKASPIMRHSITNVSVINDNNELSSLYYGDLGGNLFYAFPYIKQPATASVELVGIHELVPYKLFQSDPAAGRKIMYAPDVVAEKEGHYVYFGTGDRAAPLSDKVQDRFYCVKNIGYARLAMHPGDNNFIGDINYGNPHQNDLVDVTDNMIQAGDADEQQLANELLNEKSGWYINLEPGEKVVSSPIVYGGKVFFTTYTPKVGTDPSAVDDVCVATALTGTAKLYALDYKTGGGSMDLDDDDEITTNDRFVIIGATIPSEVVLGVYDGAVKIFVGVNDNIFELELEASPLLKIFYWRHVY